MANTIKPKRSNTAAKVPTTSDLSSGEFGVNMADQKSYINNGTTVVQVGAGKLVGLQDVTVTSPTSGQSLSWNGTEWVNSNAGAGDVVGAASSTDNAITRFDGTTGKVIQNSTVTIDDTGNIANANSINFDTTPTTPPTDEGAMYWNADLGGVAINMAGGDVVQEVGENQYIYCRASSAITKGQVVMFTGAVGASGIPTGAPATGVTDGTYIMGIAAEGIALNDFGFVQTFGVLKPVDTTGFSDGDILWYDPAVTGGFTSTKPSAPNVKVQLAAVVSGGSSGGAILIRLTAGSTLGGTDSNVEFGTLATGDLVRYNGTYWTNVATLPNSNLTNSSITINGSAISLGGSVSVGTVTSVTATSPVVSTGGATPVISMPAATTSASGYLTSTDWNTFNNKGNGTVTSVGIIAGAGISVSGSPITSSGDITISVASVASSMIYDSFTATASQTSFTTTQSYTSGKISVFKNGAKMRNGSDVTVTSGNAVVFAVACTLNDIVDIEYPTTSLSGNFVYDTFTATASQTTFTPSQTYTSGKIEVYVDGVKMRNGSDVTVTSGTSVVFASGLTVGDLVDLVYPI